MFSKNGLCTLRFLVQPYTEVQKITKKDGDCHGYIHSLILSILLSLPSTWAITDMSKFIMWTVISASIIFIQISAIYPHLGRYLLKLISGTSTKVEHVRFIITSSLVPVTITLLLVTFNLSDGLEGLIRRIGLGIGAMTLATLWGVICMTIGIKALVHIHFVTSAVISFVGMVAMTSFTGATIKMINDRRDFSMSVFQNQEMIVENLNEQRNIEA